MCCSHNRSIEGRLEKKHGLLCRAEKGRPDQHSFDCLHSALFSCLSLAAGGGTVLHLNCNYQQRLCRRVGKLLVLASYLIHFGTIISADSYMKPSTKGESSKYICIKMWNIVVCGRQGMLVSFTVVGIQNDISSKRLPWSRHAMFVYT